MRFSIAASMFFVLTTVISVTAQKKTITNADLEKYRQERLRAEKDYRENYEKLGFPSPEELAMRNEQSRIEALELADKLREEQLQREWIEVERDKLSQVYYADPESGVSFGGYGSPFFYNYGYGSSFGRHRGRGGSFRPQQSYRVGGGFIIPTGSQTRSRPAFVKPRTRGR